MNRYWPVCFGDETAMHKANSMWFACRFAKTTDVLAQLWTVENEWGFSGATAVPPGCMIAMLSALVSLLSFRVRSGASLELQLLARRHQVIALKPQGPADCGSWLTVFSGRDSTESGLNYLGTGQTGGRDRMAS
jgi:hypothetical protein